MKTNLINFLFFSFVISLLIFSSCKDDNDDDQPTPQSFENGIFISNEGIFQTGTGTISFISRSNNSVQNDIFNSVNKRPLGNVVNSITLHNGNAYIVVNNAEKVEIVNAKDFKSKGVIENLSYPRYFMGVNISKGYVSDWGSGTDGGIKVIDLNNNEVSKTITTGNGAENMIMNGDFVYVVNSGGYLNDSTISVINTSSDIVTATVEVGSNPNSIQLDVNGKLWVLCGGKWKSDWSQLEIPGKLVRLDPTSNTVEASFSFSSLTSTPSKLVINSSKDILYYSYNGGIYKQDIAVAELDTIPFINRNFYGLGFDPKDDYIYSTDPGDYSSSGWVFIYKSSNGQIVDSFKVGIIPGNFYFN